jgi:hypothetical protein
LTVAEGRRFGLTVGVAFLALGGVGWWRGRERAAAAFAAIGALLVAGALLAPTRLGPIYRAWMGLAHRLSRITTPLVLGAVFYGVVTPAGALRRLLGASPLRRAKGASGWVPRPPAARRRMDLERQF